MNTIASIRKQSVTLFRLMGCIGLGLLLSSCNTTDPVAEDPFFEEWSKRRDESLATYPIEEVFVDEQITALGEPLTLADPQEEKKALPTQVISDLVIEETEVGVVLRALARAGNQNILVGDSVAGNVVFNFADVPWDEAFRSILSSAGLTYQWEGDIIRVLSLEGMQKELEMERLLQEQRTLIASARATEPLTIRIVKVRYTDASKLTVALQSLLQQAQGEGTAQRSSVTVDEDNNAIILHAVKNEIDKIVRLIGHLDRPKPQVLIEAQIVEANRSTARELGIQWGGYRRGLSGDRVYGIESSGVDGRGLNFPAALADDEGLNLRFFGERVGAGELLDAQLTALQEDGQLNILSSPSITTLDNQTATIESGEERAYRETSGTGNNLDVSIEWKKAVLRLEVTPHVVDANTLKIEIIANKDSFDESKQESSGEFPVNTKSARTTLLLRNGETTVIGGLSQESTGNSEAGVPFLKDIPGIGELFKSRRSVKELDNILIFITPHILTAHVVDQARLQPAPESASETDTKGMKELPAPAEAISGEAAGQAAEKQVDELMEVLAEPERVPAVAPRVPEKIPAEGPAGVPESVPEKAPSAPEAEPVGVPKASVEDPGQQSEVPEGAAFEQYLKRVDLELSEVSESITKASNGVQD